MTYTGVYKDYTGNIELTMNARDNMATQFFPMLDWMKCLNHLAFIKLGPASTDKYANGSIHSLVLDELLGWLFPVTNGNAKPIADRPLRTIWIQDFSVWRSLGLDYADPKCLESFRCWHAETYNEPNEIFDGFYNLVQLDRLGKVAPTKPLIDSKLKYLSIDITSNDKEVNNFHIFKFTNLIEYALNE